MLFFSNLNINVEHIIFDTIPLVLGFEPNTSEEGINALTLIHDYEQYIELIDLFQECFEKYFLSR